MPGSMLTGLSTSMAATDVQALVDRAMAVTEVSDPRVRHRPRLLSDNGPAYISKDLKKYLCEREIGHVKGRPYHPQTQGKIERYHRTMKNVVELQTYFFPWDLEMEIGRFVDYYNHRRVHESLNNLTPEDVYRGRGHEITTARELVNRDARAATATKPGIKRDERTSDQAG